MCSQGNGLNCQLRSCVFRMVETKLQGLANFQFAFVGFEETYEEINML